MLTRARFASSNITGHDIRLTNSSLDGRMVMAHVSTTESICGQEWGDGFRVDVMCAP